MEEILKYIENHIEEEFTTRKLADLSGYSQYYFVKKFKKLTLSTPMEYVWRRKLVRSVDSIAGGKKIVEVAFDYGFQSQAAYCKAFRRAFGMSPSFLKAMCMEIEELKGTQVIFMEQAKKHMTKEELLEVLQTTLEKNQAIYDKDELEHLYQVSCKAYEGKMRYSGEEYVTHPLNVAIILAGMETETDVIYAGLFCDVDTKGTLFLKSLQPDLPPAVYKIAEEIQDRDCDIERFSEEGKLLCLAERLHNLRTFDSYPFENKRAEKIRKTIEVYLPLAREFQNSKLIDELNDLTMKYAVES